MSDIALLAHQEPVFGEAPSHTTVGWTLELADPRTLDRIARARAKVRAHVWSLIAARSTGSRGCGSPGNCWRAGHRLGRDVITVHGQGGRRSYLQGGYGFTHWTWLANTTESLAMLLRPGNAGSNTFADHLAVLTAAIGQIPSPMRSRLLVRVDGAGASHELITCLLALSSRRRAVLFNCGWGITASDQQGSDCFPRMRGRPLWTRTAPCRRTSTSPRSHLLSRAAVWPAGSQWIVRRTKPSRQQARNLTAFAKATGWRYSIIVTNIPATGITDVPGTHHSQFTGVLHREHAVVEDQGARRQGHGPAEPAIPPFDIRSPGRRVRARPGRGRPRRGPRRGGFRPRMSCPM